MKTRLECLQEATKKVAQMSKSDLDEIGSLIEHLVWALDELSNGDYSVVPKHDCEYTTNPERGHCNFCWGWWSAVSAAGLGIPYRSKLQSHKPTCHDPDGTCDCNL